MKKLSKITENLWADLQDRSSGEVIRKEDDVNLMDMDGLCDYIKNRYKDKIDSVRTFGSSGVDVDIQCIIGNKCFTTLSKAYMDRPGINKILIYLLKKTDNNFLKKVYKRFDAGDEQNTYNIQSLSITEKDRTCTNQTLVDLIDLALQEEPIKENLWADLQDRSSSEVIRKEDDVNLLDLDGLVDYIKKNYKSTTPKWNINALVSYDKMYKSLCICLFELQSGYYGYLYFIHSLESPIITIDNTFFDDDKNLLKDIEKKYTVLHMPHYVKVEPKTSTGEITNKFFLEVLDFIISELKEPSLVSTQPIKENLWADLQDRSSGEVTRKEDIIKTREELDEIIRSAYKEQGEGDTLTIDLTGKKILVEDLSSLFFKYARVKHIFGLETWDVSQVKDMGKMFEGRFELTELNIGNWDVSNVKDMKWMFQGCKNLKELDLNNWDVSQVKNMTGMFYDCEGLMEINLGNWDVSNMKYMNMMFCRCKNLKELDLNKWNVSMVEDMESMFKSCENLTELNIGNWDVSWVKDMSWMFWNCENLTKLDIENWDVSYVTNMFQMFNDCKNLQELHIENWDVSQVMYMNFMFCGCENLKELDLNNWNVGNVVNMDYMFLRCPIQYTKKGNKLIRK